MLWMISRVELSMPPGVSIRSVTPDRDSALCFLYRSGNILFTDRLNRVIQHDLEYFGRAQEME